MDLVDLDRREGLVDLEAGVVGLVGQMAQRGKKGVLVLDLTAEQLSQVLLGGGTMHSQRGG